MELKGDFNVVLFMLSLINSELARNLQLVKELSLCHKLEFSNPYIFTTE